MRSFSGFIIACFILTTSVFAQETDDVKNYAKLTKAADREKAQLAKCFSDMLTVAQRHNLRKQLIALLEAACAAEMHYYTVALLPHARKAFQSLQDLPNDQFYKLIEADAIGPMEQRADEVFKSRPVSFCSGNACALEAYRKCLFGQIADGLTKRVKPRDFEKAAQLRCRVSEGVARSVLIIEFSNAQKLQISTELSHKTRDLINEIITELRQEVIVAYREDLVKVQPGLRSCKPTCEVDWSKHSYCIPVCETDKPCLSQEEQEYQCAISD
jgi:hypothetical protein